MIAGLSRSTTLAVTFVTLLAVVPLIASMLGQPFYVSLFSRIVIFAIAAVSLDLILGYGGMVSFGHASYLGLGAYVVGIPSYFDLQNGFLHIVSVILICGAVSALIGLVALRTADVYFIMITLAFSQMIFFLFVSLPVFGGDDGLNLSPTRFSNSVSLADPIALYYASLAMLAGCLWPGSKLVRSRFGMVIRGARTNDRRMVALGFNTFRYRLTAYVISAVTCGLAGLLLANQTLFVSPAMMYWSRSGELLIMVVIGGIGTLVGR